MRARITTSFFANLIITALVVLTASVMAHKFYQQGRPIELIPLATICLGLLAAWGNFFRQRKTAQEIAQPQLVSRILNSTLGTVLSANICALGGIGLVNLR